MSTSLLSTPLAVGALRLANRIVMPPMVGWQAGEDGAVTPAILAHYAESVGTGLVVVEASAISPEGRLHHRQIGIFEDRQVEGLRALAAVVRRGGAAASIQLHHAGRQTSRKETGGLPLVAPSAVRFGEATARELTAAEIESLLAAFAAAARRAQEAGFDAVEIHAAHGYLISQFLSPLANRRTDRWGGNLGNRARFLRELVGRAREATGGRLLVYCRLGVMDGDPGGLKLQEGIQVARWLEEDGVPLLHVSSGINDPPRLAPPESGLSDRIHLAAAVKRAVRIPVIGVGGILQPQAAEAALAGGLADLVAVGRGILADPRWAVKALQGRAGEIVPCRGCARCRHFGHPERCPARLAAAAAQAAG